MKLASQSKLALFCFVLVLSGAANADSSRLPNYYSSFPSTANGSDGFDVVVPVVSSTPTQTLPAGTIFYQTGVGFKGVNTSGTIDTIGVTGNPVTSGASSDRVERITFGGSGEPAACSSSPCSTYRKSSNWIAADSSLVRTGAGAYTITIASGYFSDRPTCTCTVLGAASANTCKLYATSSTSFNLNSLTSGGTATDDAFNVICVGPK